MDLYNVQPGQPDTASQSGNDKQYIVPAHQMNAPFADGYQASSAKFGMNLPSHTGLLEKFRAWWTGKPLNPRGKSGSPSGGFSWGTLGFGAFAVGVAGLLLKFGRGADAEKTIKNAASRAEEAGRSTGNVESPPTAPPQGAKKTGNDNSGTATPEASVTDPPPKNAHETGHSNSGTTIPEPAVTDPPPADPKETGQGNHGTATPNPAPAAPPPESPKETGQGNSGTTTPVAEEERAETPPPPEPKSPTEEVGVETPAPPPNIKSIDETFDSDASRLASMKKFFDDSNQEFVKKLEKLAPYSDERNRFLGQTAEYQGQKLASFITTGLKSKDKQIQYAAGITKTIKYKYLDSYCKEQVDKAIIEAGKAHIDRLERLSGAEDTRAFKSMLERSPEYDDATLATALSLGLQHDNPIMSEFAKDLAHQDQNWDRLANNPTFFAAYDAYWDKRHLSELQELAKLPDPEQFIEKLPACVKFEPDKFVQALEEGYNHPHKDAKAVASELYKDHSGKLSESQRETLDALNKAYRDSLTPTSKSRLWDSVKRTVRQDKKPNPIAATSMPEALGTPAPATSPAVGASAADADVKNTGEASVKAESLEEKPETVAAKDSEVQTTHSSSVESGSTKNSQKGSSTSGNLFTRGRIAMGVGSKAEKADRATRKAPKRLDDAVTEFNSTVSGNPDKAFEGFAKQQRKIGTPESRAAFFEQVEKAVTDPAVPPKTTEAALIYVDRLDPNKLIEMLDTSDPAINLTKVFRALDKHDDVEPEQFKAEIEKAVSGPAGPKKDAASAHANVLDGRTLESLFDTHPEAALKALLDKAYSSDGRDRFHGVVEGTISRNQRPGSSATPMDDKVKAAWDYARYLPSKDLIPLLRTELNRDPKATHALNTLNKLGTDKNDVVAGLLKADKDGNFIAGTRERYVAYKGDLSKEDGEIIRESALKLFGNPAAFRQPQNRDMAFRILYDFPETMSGYSSYQSALQNAFSLNVYEQPSYVLHNILSKAHLAMGPDIVPAQRKFENDLKELLNSKLASTDGSDKKPWEDLAARYKKFVDDENSALQASPQFNPLAGPPPVPVDGTSQVAPFSLTDTPAVSGTEGNVSQASSASSTPKSTATVLKDEIEEIDPLPKPIPVPLPTPFPLRSTPADVTAKQEIEIPKIPNQAFLTTLRSKETSPPEYIEHLNTLDKTDPKTAFVALKEALETGDETIQARASEIYSDVLKTDLFKNDEDADRVLENLILQFNRTKSANALSERLRNAGPVEFPSVLKDAHDEPDAVLTKVFDHGFNADGPMKAQTVEAYEKSTRTEAKKPVAAKYRDFYLDQFAEGLDAKGFDALLDQVGQKSDSILKAEALKKGLNNPDPAVKLSAAKRYKRALPHSLSDEDKSLETSYNAVKETLIQKHYPDEDFVDSDTAKSSLESLRQALDDNTFVDRIMNPALESLQKNKIDAAWNHLYSSTNRAITPRFLPELKAELNKDNPNYNATTLLPQLMHLDKEAAIAFINKHPDNYWSYVAIRGLNDEARLVYENDYIAQISSANLPKGNNAFYALEHHCKPTSTEYQTALINTFDLGRNLVSSGNLSVLLHGLKNVGKCTDENAKRKFIEDVGTILENNRTTDGAPPHPMLGSIQREYELHKTK